jgi:succinate dehydrogenase / fumarate reductase iron-sulfur subunit
MTRMEEVMEETPNGEPVLVKPMQAFPLTKDLVTNTSWAYEMNKKMVPINGPEEKNWEFNQNEANRIQEFRACIECMLCVNTCHVLREHQKFDEFAGPRFFVRLAGLEMHPLDVENRIPEIKEDFGIGYCNITRCCTEVCPAGINITDNAIIPLKERVVSEYYDPISMLAKKIGLKKRLISRNYNLSIRIFFTLALFIISGNHAGALAGFGTISFLPVNT